MVLKDAKSQQKNLKFIDLKRRIAKVISRAKIWVNPLKRFCSSGVFFTRLEIRLEENLVEYQVCSTDPN